MPLITAGPLYYLPAHVSRTTTTGRRHEAVNCSVDALEQLVDVKLYEYCCAPDSLLAAWFQAHGQEAERL
eukprot:8056525-Heterocapsa_arctica.AAC.1